MVAQPSSSSRVNRMPERMMSNPDAMKEGDKLPVLSQMALTEESLPNRDHKHFPHEHP